MVRPAIIAIIDVPTRERSMRTGHVASSDGEKTCPWARTACSMRIRAVFPAGSVPTGKSVISLMKRLDRSASGWCPSRIAKFVASTSATLRTPGKVPNSWLETEKFTHRSARRFRSTCRASTDPRSMMLT